MEAKVGDVARLKSGSVDVTVTARFPPKGDDAIGLCKCMFFADGKFGEVMIPELALELVEREEDLYGEASRKKDG